MQAKDIQKKFRELYHSDEVIIELARLGDVVVEPIGEYLAGNPEVTPQARVAAVRTLGIIGSESALDQLKKILFKHELKNIDPVFAQSEYVVKNAIIEELLRNNSDNTRCNFLAAFQRYRLPAAIQAIVKYHILEGIPSLIAALEDDVLAGRAAEALRQLGKDSIPALLQAIKSNDMLDNIGESRISRQRRILAATILGNIGDKTIQENLSEMLEDSNPNIAGSAAAALIKLELLSPSPRNSELLLKAALSTEWTIRDPCRVAAVHLGETGIDGALKLIHLKKLPDLYGASTEISPFLKSWLVTYIVENANSSHFIDTLIKESPQELLYEGLKSVKSNRSVSNLICLAKHKNHKIRSIVAHLLRRMHDPKAVEVLILFLGDWDRETVKEASESLAGFSKETIEDIAKNQVPSVRPAWKRIVIKMRLKKIIKLM